MDDLDDIAEAIFDIEDIVEEVVEPEEFLEDFVENPLLVIFAIVAGFAAILTVLLLLFTVALLVLAVGPVGILVLLTVLNLLLLGLAIAGFLYVRTDIPSDVQQKINDALREADDTPKKEGSMTEEEAVTELKEEYARGNLDDHELEQALEDALTSERPEEVVEEYD